MNRNVESGFAYNPSVNIHRSRFHRNSSVKTTFNVGQLIPFYVDEVLPGDTFDVTTSKVVRLQTLLTPMMDNIYLDFYWFFVPNRLVWRHWKELNGENNATYWEQQVQYSVPQCKFTFTNDNYVGTVADYMGIPTYAIASSGNELSVSALPFRAYGLIYNEFFRDENLIAPDNVPLDDLDVYFSGTQESYFGGPYTVSKYHDYFTSCLPAPQKGPDVVAPMETFGWTEYDNAIPVVTGSAHSTLMTLSNPVASITFANPSNGSAYSSTQSLYTLGSSGALRGANSTDSATNSLAPSNLWALLGDTSLQAGLGVNINQLRLAFQVQKLYERDARGGTRYIEILKSHFGVTSPDARLQRPEYLGGNRVPININQVIQMSESGSSPLGHTAGMSVTSDIHSDFTKSFTEHGFVIGLCVARYDHTYQQGIERFWSRKDRFDYYWPVFANIGEQAVLNKEIFADGSSSDDEVFGYQEAWADYRYKPNRVTGEMRSSYVTSLDVWHLADDYLNRPSLSQAWIQEDSSNVDRVLAVTSRVSNQIMADIYVKNKTTRPMPLYSIPGLIDHH